VDDGDDADLAAQLEELEAFSRRLDSDDEDDPRPATGGTSASASTTAHGDSSGSFGCEGASGEDEEAEDEGDSCAVLNSDPFASLRGSQRAQYELQQLTLPHGCRVETSPGSAAQLFLYIDIAEGPYMPSTLVFWIKIFDEFPALDGYSIRCTKKMFHPSVDVESRHVEIEESRLNAPSFPTRLGALIGALRSSMVSPEDTPTVNIDAAVLLQTDPDDFRRVVRLTLNGGEHNGVRFDRIAGAGRESEGAATPVRTPAQREMSNNMKMDLMQIEVMRDQCRERATALQQQNATEIRDLERDVELLRAIRALQ